MCASEAASLRAQGRLCYTLLYVYVCERDGERILFNFLRTLQCVAYWLIHIQGSITMHVLFNNWVKSDSKLTKQKQKALVHARAYAARGAWLRAAS